MEYETKAIVIENFDLLVAAGLVLIAGLTSVLLRLKLETKLLHASLRTVIQLFLVGFVLKYVFEANHFILIFGIVLLMIFVASFTAVRRSTRKIKGIYTGSFFTLTFSGLLTAYFVTKVVIGVEPWFTPRYLIPLLGMILGNGLTGISLCLDKFLERLSEQKDQVELNLSLGATRYEATNDFLKDSVRTGMIPILNSMMVVGIVALPGMMTGQILAGADPVQAVKYQIIVMFMLAAATSLGCILITLLLYKRLLNHKHQLCSGLILKRS